MRKVIIFILLISIFIIGIKIGDSNKTYNYNYLIEQEKNYFESEIIKPNNEYDNKELVPNDNVMNKVAKKIDKTIDKLVDKLKNILKNF